MKTIKLNLIWKNKRRVVLTLLVVWGAFLLIGEFIASFIVLPVARTQIEQFTGSEVSIKSVNMQITGHAEIKGLSVSSCIDEMRQNPVLEARTVEVVFPIFSILTFRPRLKSIKVEDFEFDLRYDTDLSTMNLAFFNVGKSDTSGEIPVVSLEKGTVRFSKVTGGVAESIFSVRIENGAIADRGDGSSCGFFFNTGASEFGVTGSIGGKWERGKNGKVIINKGNFSTGLEPIFGNVWDLRQLSMDLEYGNNGVLVNHVGWEMGDNCRVWASGSLKDVGGEGLFSVDAHLRDMQTNKEFKPSTLVYGEGLGDKIGAAMKRFLEAYSPDGVGDFDFEAKGKISEVLKANWKGDLTCKDISINYTKFPYLLEHLNGQLRLGPDNIVLDGLKCKHGDVDLEINGLAENYRNNYSYQIRVTSANMLLGDDIYRALPRKQQNIWYTFTPRGRAKIDYKYERKANGEKDRLVVVDMLGAEADYLHFPYHLENVTGRVTIGIDEVELTDMVSTSKDSTITLNGRVTETRSDRPRYNILINAKNILIDSRLKAALPFSQRSFYDSFQMTARTDAKIEVFPNETGKRPVEYIARVNIKDASLVYDGFPLPLTGVDVEAVLTADATFLNKLTGKNGDGEVFVNGTVWPASEKKDKPSYCLSLNAKNINIQDNWLKSLPKDAYGLLEQLRPVGKINVSANISEDSRVACPEFKIVVDGVGCGVNYTKFPYPVENIYGRVTIEKDRVTIEDLRSSNPDSGESIVLNGTIAVDEHKVSSGKFSVSAENIEFGTRLAKAFEGVSNDFYKRLSPSGSFDLDIDDFSFGNDPNEGRRIGFVSELTLKDCSIQDSRILDGINGKVTSAWIYKIGEGLQDGKAKFVADELRIKNREINNLRGGIVYDPNSDAFLSREYTAQCYGGKVLGSMSVGRWGSKKMKYELEAIFSDVDLHGLAAAGIDQSPGRNYTKGLVSGYFGVTGVPGDGDSKVGRLNMDISGMEFARRSLLGKIITASQLGDPTNFIFSDLIAEAYLQKDTLFIDKVDIFGKSMQMRGIGVVDIGDGSIDVNFNAFGKRTSSPPSLLESLSRSLGGAVAQVEVDGTFDSPEVKTTTLPVIQKPFGILGSKDEGK